MNDTPRTDAFVLTVFSDHQGWKNHPLTDYARNLERELAQLREDKARLDWLDLRDRITWSHEEKDPMDMRILPIRAAIDAARTAKGATP
jgi:hypothetical protein